jgi:hypothetical protein
MTTSKSESCSAQALVLCFFYEVKSTNHNHNVFSVVANTTALYWHYRQSRLYQTHPLPSVIHPRRTNTAPWAPSNRSHDCFDDIRNVNSLEDRTQPQETTTVPAMSKRNCCGSLLELVLANPEDEEKPNSEKHHLERDDHIWNGDREVLVGQLRGGMQIIRRSEEGEDDLRT